MPPAAWAQGATETETDPMQDVTINCQRQINPYQKLDWQNWVEAIQKSKAFENFVILVIMIAAVSVGAKTYDIPQFTLNLIETLERVIITIFVVELVIRLLATRPRHIFFKDVWNVFDSLVVAVSLVPIEDSDMALVARLARVFWILRIAGIKPEIKLLLDSFLIAVPKLMYVMVMMFIIFYIYATLGSLLFETVDPHSWGDIGLAMLTLFKVMTFDGWTEIMSATMDKHSWSWLYYLSFIFLTAFAFLNMIIGIIVNVLEEEYQSMITVDPDRISNKNLSQDIKEIKLLIQSQRAETNERS
ncbi:MAG: ion transporter [Gammaproteobacteria bacterium]|nr:ion transporter [Gammaproteobacteria bacterium]